MSRVVLAGVVHHVVARGVDKKPIFASGFDKGRYLKRFAKIASEENVQIHGYCLMSNHVHWIVTPATSRGLARLFSRVHTWWAMYFNRRRGRTGHLFQSRYHSSPLDEAHYWSALRYVELNPTKANLVRQPEHWAWSSARSHLTPGRHRLVRLVPVVTLRQIPSSEWREFLNQASVEQDLALERANRGCRPYGSDDWIRALEVQLKRKLQRPPKSSLLQTASPAA